MIGRFAAVMILLPNLVFAAGFGGIGIDGVPLENGEIMVRQIVAGGPAHLAGIKPGDVITQIDGTATARADFDHLVKDLLRGKSGTKVTIAVRRPPRAKPLVFTLTRRELVTKQ